jgi:hypothetical protein
MHFVSLRVMLGAAAVAALVGGTGCASVIGDQEIETIFRVNPKNDGSFWGWSEVSFDEDPSQVDSAEIGWVTLHAEDPPHADLTFIKTVMGEAVTETERTPLAQQSVFPPGEDEVLLDLLYDGDIRGFVQPDEDDAHKIRIEWSGSTDPAFTAWPENGFRIRVTALIKID